MSQTDPRVESIPQSLVREDGKTVPLATCVTLDEATARRYSTPIRVESIFKQDDVSKKTFYNYNGGNRRRYDPVLDIELDDRTIMQANQFGIDLDNPEDLLGTCFVRGRNGPQISLDDLNARSPKRWGKVLSFDQAPNLFIRRELQRNLPKLVELEKSMADTARAIFPVENFGQVGLCDYTWQQIRADSPEAVWVDPHEDRPTPTVKFERAEQSRKIQAMKHGFTLNWYTMEQIATAKANGSPDLRIESRSLEEARLQCLRLENRGVLFGNQSLGILGLLSQKVGTVDPLVVPTPNMNGIPQVASPVPGKWLSEVFLGAEGTGEEMYDLITKAFVTIHTQTEDVEKPDTIALGIEDYVNINRKIYKGINSDSTDSVAKVVLKNLAPLGLKAIVLLPELGYRQLRADVLAEKSADFNASDPYNIGNTFAETYAGGLFKRNTMLIFKRDPEKSAIIVGHDLLVRPPLDMGDNKQTTVFLFSGGFLAKKPQSLQIVVAPTG